MVRGWCDNEMVELTALVATRAARSLCSATKLVNAGYSIEMRPTQSVLRRSGGGCILLDFLSIRVRKSCVINAITFSTMNRPEHCVNTARCTDVLHARAWLKAQVVPSIKKVILSLVPRHVSRPAQYTQYIDLILTVLHFSFAHQLRLKVDHVPNTLRRFTGPQS